MMEPAKRAQLSTLDVHAYAAAIANSLHSIYVIIGILGAIVFALTLALPANMRPGDAPAAP
jgi:hypothetical protein